MLAHGAAQAAPVTYAIDTGHTSPHFESTGTSRGRTTSTPPPTPLITFKSTRVTFDGDRPAALEGNLTIKGVTRPVTLTVTAFTAKPHPMYKKPALGADAVGRIKRSDFNMGKHVPYVSDEVDLSIAVEAIRE